MAYSAVASLLQTIDLVLNYHERSISAQFKTQIISIHQHTCSLQSFIEGFSDRVNNWEETIREVTDRAEQIIELLLSDSLLKSSDGDVSPRSELEKGKYEEVNYSFDELEKIAEELESIVNKVKRRRRMETYDGADEELLEVVCLLLGVSSSLEIIAICGSGGTGKATLAKNAFFHPLIRDHFDVFLGTTRADTWVFVVRELLVSMKAEFSRSSSEDELFAVLSHNLGRRRYLILLDDVWSKDVMGKLKTMLPDYGNGSRILLTTRSSDLAMSADHIHEMSLLDEDKAWNLLREKIFGGDPCPFQLEPIGKTIARRCGGHQLSIAVVSGILLASDQTEAAWEDVADNMKKILASEDGDTLSEILHLSYIYLPHHLRPCFLYMGMFPAECYIRVSRLIQYLVVEGFVNESGYKSLGETGQEYVEDLARRNLVFVHKRNSNGRIKAIEIHYLIRDVCLRQAHIDNFNLHSDSPQLKANEIMMSCRRVSTLFFCDDSLRGDYGSTIRTLILYLEQGHGTLDLRPWIENIQLLRILDLIAVKSYYLFDKIFELFHLRYLAIDCSSNIPKAISNLENLQTLFIWHQEGGVFDQLPDGIWRMPQLRHLKVIEFKFPNKKEPTSAPQESLQTLLKVVDLVSSREILKMIPNLKKLDLIYTKNLRDVVENYELHNLIFLQKLEHLKLQTRFSVGEEHKVSCAFPPTLKKLSLRGLQLSWEDMKIVASLPNLEMLKLRNHACVGERWETSEGGFSRLSILLIEESNLENWITKSSHFPRLSRLVLRRCSSMLEVPYEMAEIPTLKEILTDKTNGSLWRSVKQIEALWGKGALSK